jgi:hypothetical protein
MARRDYVSVRISDGLGNQMFQYAAGLAVARRLGVPLRCDTSSFIGNRRRQLGLPAFGLKLEGTWRGNFERLGLLRRDPAVRVVTDSAEFVPEVLTVEAPVRLEGWFQSWRYFAACADEVRAAFDFERIALGAAATATLERIRAADSPVAVHVRRGDYRGLPSAFPLLDAGHYGRARARLEVEVVAPRYFVFSDEPEVARELTRGWPEVTVLSGFSALEDYRLMASCRHFLVANSTFSWWAAWLGRSPDKRVIAPSVWYGEGFSRKVDIDARLPPEWIRV